MSQLDSQPLDAQLETRLVEWLQRHHVPLVSPDLREDLRRLAALDGLVLDAAGFVARLGDEPLPPWHVDRLLRLHAAWESFRRLEASGAAHDWVARVPATSSGTGHATDDDVLWVDGSDGRGDDVPAGPAPSLLPPGGRPRRSRPPARRLLRPTDLVVPLAVLAVLGVGAGLLLRDRGAYAAELRRSAALTAEREDGPHFRARAARVAHQAGLAAHLQRTRQRQRQLVNARCEGGAWCRARLDGIDGSLRLARELLTDAGLWGAPAEPMADWSPPPGLFARELDGLAEELAGGIPDEPRAAILREVRELLREAGTP